MLLAVNANNTNVKFAVYDGETLRGDWRLHTSPARKSPARRKHAGHRKQVAQRAPPHRTAALMPPAPKSQAPKPPWLRASNIDS